jgi:hypothetical protein
MKKRSKYKPKGVRMDALTWVISGFKKVADVPDAGTKLMLKNHVSFDEIREGRGDTGHVDNMISMVNMAEALAKRQLGRDWLPEIKEAQDAIFTMAQRGVSGKPFLFTGLELQAVELILNLHDEQLKNCPVRTLELALDDIAKEFKGRKMRKIEPIEPSIPEPKFEKKPVNLPIIDFV